MKKNKSLNIYDKCLRIAKNIELSKKDLIDILIDYESYPTAKDEINRSLKFLYNIDKEKEYLNKKNITTSVFLPLNLPLYSTVLFVIMPSLLSEYIYLRPPILIRNVLDRIFRLLKLQNLLEGIEVLMVERNQFIRDYVKNSKVIIFSGKYGNARDLISKIPRDILFLYNGSGANPIIVTNSADTEFSVKKVIEARIFNSGQDCAAPNSILLQSEIAKRFIATLVRYLKKIKIGAYQNKNTTVGKLIDITNLQYISRILVKYHKDIIYGGKLDFIRGIVYPSIILKKLREDKNYLEFFAPIFYLSIYNKDSDLSLYFDNNEYLNRAMYVSVFGKSIYASKIKKSIILKDRIVLDFEDGHEEFGGYGQQASFICKNGKTIYKPILISREINNYVK